MARPEYFLISDEAVIGESLDFRFYFLNSSLKPP